ncbi:MAG: deoxyribonuclease V [Gammaproteobacteria bacterium]|nr:deoxyribonuclease V [Gammaproteobacteria bacterium]
MTVRVRHGWRVTPKQAIGIQQQLRSRVRAVDERAPVRYVAGVDVGFEDGGTVARAAVVVLAWPSLVEVEHAIARRPVAFPYVPGLLSFREIPVVLAALRRLHLRPDLVLCDGQGYAHPRRFGIACHLGVLLDWPTVGVAKSLLVGTHAPLPVARGRWRALRADGEIIGAALRTRTGVRPVYVSVGHRVSLRTALRFVLGCAPRYRLPETTRAAHFLASIADRPLR